MQHTTPDYISQSLTVSTKTQAMLMQIDNKCMFIEYPTNILPHPDKLDDKRNIVSVVDCETFSKLKSMFDSFDKLKRSHAYLHAPSFIFGYCSAVGIDCYGFNILQ